MTLKQFRWRLRYAFQFFPFTTNTVLSLAALWFAWYLLYKPVPKGEELSFVTPFILLIGKMVLFILVGVIAVSIVSTIVCWLVLITYGKAAPTLKIDFTTEAIKGKKNRLFLNATLEFMLRPFLGFVKGRLIYDDNQFTDRFSLLSNRKKTAANKKSAITGRSRMVLPDIKEYDLKGGFVYFQDMLHIFSLAVPQPISGHFYQPPILVDETDADVFPKRTTTLDVRIEQLRRVEGEYLSYKDFEAGDDVRRIVWKVYARNRELVVRVPEMYEPYASHLYYYASFNSTLKTHWQGEGYLREMLNYYKNCVWTVYDTLAKKEWNLNFIPDQSINVGESADIAEQTARIISNSNWQSDTDLQHYFNPKVGSVLCISSLVDTVDLKNLLDRCDSSTVVYFVKISQVMKRFAALNLISRLILLPPKDKLSRLRARWPFSPLRLQINKREKEIEAVLSKSSVTWGVL